MMQTIFMHQQYRSEAGGSSSPSDESVRLAAGFALTPKAFASGRRSREGRDQLSVSPADCGRKEYRIRWRAELLRR